MPHKKMVISPTEIADAISSLASQIINEFNASGKTDYALIGLHSCGVPLALRLREVITEKTKTAPDFGTLDISMYRDDIGVGKSLRAVKPTELPFDLNDKVVILVDDVFCSGRTIRAALDALTDYGRPAIIRLAVLVDRRCREYPISPDYVGIHLDTPSDRRIFVHFSELHGEDGVYEAKWTDKK